MIDTSPTLILENVVDVVGEPELTMMEYGGTPPNGVISIAPVWGDAFQHGREVADTLKPNAAFKNGRFSDPATPGPAAREEARKLNKRSAEPEKYRKLASRCKSLKYEIPGGIG